MNKLIPSFLLLFILTSTCCPDLIAQGMVSRLLRTGKYKYYRRIDQCNKMGAYNADNPSRFRIWWAMHMTQPTAKTSPSPVSKAPVENKTAQAKQENKPTPPANNKTNTTSSTEKQAPQASLNNTTPPNNSLASTSASAKKESPVPAAAPAPLAKPVAKEKTDNSTLLRQDEFKKMTEAQRRETLAQIQPEIVLPPIRFIQDQDEFSVANMDSFMQAMEFAQQGKIVLVEGHTDDLGSDEYNLKLSMKRAEKIRQLLMSGGVGDDLISVIGYGESQPLVPNTSTENRSINRRIEFKVFSLPQ